MGVFDQVRTMYGQSGGQSGTPGQGSSGWGATFGGLTGGGLPGAGFIRNAFARPGEQDQRKGLMAQGAAAGNFADQGQQQYSVLGAKLGDQAQYLENIARGRESVSGEQLRQALGQNLAAQQSMAAGASPQNAGMAALMASRNAMQLGSGLAGQQALAGLQERQAAQNALMQALLGQRGQDMQVALGSRQNAIAGYGGITPGKSPFEQVAGPLTGLFSLGAGGGGK